MNFYQKIKAQWAKNNSLICVGLDPDLDRFPDCLAKEAKSIFPFNKSIIDATHDLVCAYKPQIAHFSAYGAEDELERTIQYIHENYPEIPVILDAKRGDIGSTAQKYAKEVFERYKADAVTINPYLGFDSIEPFTDYKDKGVIILCRTSNPSAIDLQDLVVKDGDRLYEKVAVLASTKWNNNKNCALVIGATWPSQMSDIRELAGDMIFLVPGAGSQGGNVKQLVEAGKTNDGTGLIINSSRGILYASQSDSYADYARAEALKLRDLVNQYR